MTADDSTATVTAPESSGDIVDRLEQRILSRRAFLAGVGLGGAGGAGAVIGLTRSNARNQSLATLAGAG